MPQLRIAGPDGSEQWFELEGDEFILGRDPQTSIPLPDKKVSRRHARIFLKGKEYFVEDLGSANGVLINGAPIRRPVVLVSGTELEVGPFQLTFVADPEAGGEVQFSLVGLKGPVAGQTYQLPVADVFVGRGEDCDIAIPDGSISRQHAVLEVHPDSLMVEDLGSSNGTFVNDARVAREPLQPGDRVRFGNVEFEVVAEGVRPSFGLPGGELLQRLRQADSSVKLAAGMAATTVLLLIIVVMILIVRFTSDGPRTDPFVSYERAIEVGLASARAQFQAEAWDNAVRSYRDVLDQDPINPDARRGLYESQTNKEHKHVLSLAQQALDGGRPLDAVSQLNAIPPDAFYGRQAAALIQKARSAIAANALQEAREACRKRDWRRCHTQAVTALTHEPQSAPGLSLVVEAEKALKSKKIPYTPWSP